MHPCGHQGREANRRLGAVERIEEMVVVNMRKPKPKSPAKFPIVGIWDFTCERSVLRLSGAVVIWEPEFPMVTSRVYKSSYSRYCIATCLLAGPNKHDCFDRVNDLVETLTEILTPIRRPVRQAQST